jgi:hypothetical protein
VQKTLRVYFPHFAAFCLLCFSCFSIFACVLIHSFIHSFKWFGIFLATLKFLS